MALLVGITVAVAYWLFVLGIVALARAGGLGPSAIETAFSLILFGLSWWVSKDSAQVEFERRQTWLAMRPGLRGLLVFVPSPIVLPWYVAERYRIRTGTLRKTT